DSDSVAAPAKSNSDMWLGSKANLVGVDSNEQQHIGGTRFGAANAEGRGVAPSPRGCIARPTRGVGGSWTEMRTHAGVVREYRGTGRGSRIVHRDLRFRDGRPCDYAQERVPERSVRF